MTQANPLPYRLEEKRVFVAGHNGMVGRAVCDVLAHEPCETLTAPRDTLDLTRQNEVEAWFEETRPQAVIVCAARVGGILANDTYPVDFLYDNITISSNIIRAAHESGVEKLLFLGSSCIYPRDAKSPMGESALLTGALEETNQWYAIAKIAGIKLCQAYRKQYGDDFISVMPTNLYGEHDDFNLETSHVIPALMHKCHLAKTHNTPHLEVWGSGTPRREFLYVRDCAEGIVFLLKHHSAAQQINIGTGTDLSIAELAETIKAVVGYEGALVFDDTKPDGTPRKLLDVSALNALGFRAKTDLQDGLERVYEWYRANIA